MHTSTHPPHTHTKPALTLPRPYRKIGLPPLRPDAYCIALGTLLLAHDRRPLAPLMAPYLLATLRANLKLGYVCAAA